MDSKPEQQSAADPTGQGIELSDRPRYQELQSPGLEVISTPGLEVLAPSDLEVIPASNLEAVPPFGYGWEKKAGGFSPGDYGGSPHTAYSAAPAPAYALPSPYEQKDSAPLTGAAGGAGERRIAGLKRNTFFIILALGTFLVVVGIAVGVGVGVALGKADSPSSPTSTPNANATATRSFPLPTAQATTGSTSVISCPANNLTLYTSPSNQSKHFTLLCGRDYHSGGGTVDLFNQAADTMGECIDMCAEQEGCVGVGWGSYEGRNLCWLKSFLATPQASALWYFAALDNVTGLDLPKVDRRRVILI